MCANFLYQKYFNFLNVYQYYSVQYNFQYQFKSNQIMWKSSEKYNTFFFRIIYYNRVHVIYITIYDKLWWVLLFHINVLIYPHNIQENTKPKNKNKYHKQFLCISWETQSIHGYILFLLKNFICMWKILYTFF